MVKDDDFQMALQFLHLLTLGHVVAAPLRPLTFSAEYAKQPPPLTALKILHEAVLEGSYKQKKILYQKREAIAQINRWLQNTSSFCVHIEKVFGSKVSAYCLEGMQLASPESYLVKLFKICTSGPLRFFAAFQDLLYIPLAFALEVAFWFKKGWDPKENRRDITPILLLHGMNYNQMVFLFGRYYLRKKGHGAVFSFNYGGRFTTPKGKGIDDYAKGCVAEKIREICQKTGKQEVILVGHSMGGLIAGYYAEYVAPQESIRVRQVITIGSPWGGSPLIHRFLANKWGVKRLQQMACKSLFLRALRERALQSERLGYRTYYSVLSKADPLVPGFLGKVSEDPRRQWISGCLGHMMLCFSRCVWKQIFNWIHESKRV